jgi:Fe2+ or Zn2+ uptake regulation protein
MARKVKRPRIGKNQRKVLDILEKYQELTAKDIAEILWARDVRYQTPEFSSVHRSLRILRERGLVEKVGGPIKWRRTEKPHNASKDTPHESHRLS